MGLKTIVLILGILCFNLGIAQTTPNTSDTQSEIKVADSLYKQAINLYSIQRNYEKAKLQFDIVDSLYQNLDIPEKVVASKRYKALCLHALYSSYKEQIKPLNEGLSFVSRCKKNSIEVAKLYIKLSEAYMRNYQVDNARYYALKALYILNVEENVSTISNSSLIIANLIGLGLIEHRVSNLDLAELYLNKALVVASKYNPSENNHGESRVKGILFGIYLENNQIEKVKAFLKKENESKFLSSALLSTKVDYFRRKTDYYSDSKQFDLALLSVNDLQDIINASPYKAHFSELAFIDTKAQIYFKMKRYKDAIKLAESVINSKDLDLAQNESRVSFFLLLTKNYLALNNFEKAKENLQEAFGLNYINQKNKDFYDKIEVSEIVNKKNNTLTKLQLKAEICITQYKQTNNQKYFNAALHTYETLNEFIKIIGRKSNEDKYITDVFFKSTYGNLLDLYHTQWNLNTKNEALFYKALNVCDESKIVSVLNEISAIKQGKLFKSIPKNIIDQEQKIQIELDSINRLFITTSNNKLLTQSKDSLETVFKNFKADLKEKVPNYFQLKYGTDKSIESIINEKYSHYNILQFFWGENAIYVFNSNGTKKHFDKIVLSDTLKKEINTLLNTFRDNKNETHKTLGLNVYNQLFKKYIDSQKKTIVVLDDKLHLLPIEALFNSEQNQYLVEETSILRLNSLKQEIILPSNKTQGIKLFAPYTTKGFDNNQKLEMSLSEVNQISKMFKSEVFLDEQASKQEFLKQLSNNHIIHLATHSSVDSRDPMKSKIYFNNYGNLEPSKVVLQIEELYNMNLNSNLVTLSSCETGIGKEVKGKGVLSLSNALSYAGVSSIVMSLWKVPDKETSKVIVSFYKHLNNGEPKDEALRNAKLDYLNSTSDEALKHPYFWAGFVISGDPSPIKNDTPFYYYILGAIFLLMLFLLFRSKLIKGNRN